MTESLLVIFFFYLISLWGLCILLLWIWQFKIALYVKKGCMHSAYHSKYAAYEQQEQPAVLGFLKQAPLCCAPQ